MYLNNLSLVNFKNYLNADLTFSQAINCITGENGVGKTNILDAIHYLSLCKSYFNPIDSQNINHDNNFFIIEGQYNLDEKDEKIYCGIKKNQKKKFSRNKKEYKKLSEHVGLIPLVMLSPADIKLIIDGSEERRKFIDGVIAQYNKEYLNNIIKYNKALAQRNLLLKQFAEKRYFERSEIEIWDFQLVQYGNSVFETRSQFVNDLFEVFQDYYQNISGANETVSLKYKSDLINQNFEDLLKQNIDKDRALQYTSKGIHRDDLIMEMNGYPVKKVGSQGQQKTFLVSLKLAKYDFIKNKVNKKPILLLDDIFDKFDHQRFSKIIQMISNNNFGQIFITDTDPERLYTVLAEIDQEHKVFNVDRDQQITNI